MKKVITKIKKEVKQKPKIKKVKSIIKSKINKQNQNVKVNIKIGNEGKSIDHRQPQSSNSITTYPLLQNAPPPINIINNHENRHPPIAPPHVPIVPVNPIVPANPIVPVNPIVPANPIGRIHIIRLKKIKKTRKIRNVNIVDDIPSPTPNYESDDSLSKFYNVPSPHFDYGQGGVLLDDGTIKSPGKSIFNRQKVLNPMTNRMVYQDSKTYRNALREYKRIHNK